MVIRHFVRKEEGKTGRIRFRRQAYTGLPVLQVEVSGYSSRYPWRNEGSQDVRWWRDATMEEAYSVQFSASNPSGEKSL